LRNIVIRLTTKYAAQPVDAAQLRAELDTESLDSPVSGIPALTNTTALMEAAFPPEVLSAVSKLLRPADTEGADDSTSTKSAADPARPWAMPMQKGRTESRHQWPCP
jgi:hypothetical protein